MLKATAFKNKIANQMNKNKYSQKLFSWFDQTLTAFRR